MKHTRSGRILPLLLAVALVFTLAACTPLEGVLGRLTGGKFVDDEPYAGYKLEKYVKLGEYKGVEGDFVTVDEYLDLYMQDVFAQYGAAKGIVDDPAKTEVAEGDLVFFDFEGSAPGVSEAAREGMKGKALLVIGSGQFLPAYLDAEGKELKRGFEDQMVGQPRDKEFAVDVRFPDQYHQEELAGKDVIFQCTVHKIGAASEEITDEGVDVLTNGEFATAEAFRAMLAEDMGDPAKTVADYNGNLAFEAAYANAEILKLPAREQDYWDGQLEKSASRQGMDVDDYATQSGYQSAAEYRDKQVSRELFVFAVAQKEGITVSEEDVQGLLAEIRTNGYEGTDAELYSEFGGKGYLLRHLMSKNVTDFILANAKGVPAAAAE